MSFDAWVVAFGLSTVLQTLHLVSGRRAFSVLAVVAIIDAWLLYRFFAAQAREAAAAPVAVAD
jgi:hypothetical protein